MVCGEATLFLKGGFRFRLWWKMKQYLNLVCGFGGVLLLAACQTTPTSSESAYYNPYGDLPEKLPQELEASKSTETKVDEALTKILGDVAPLPEPKKSPGFSMKLPDGSVETTIIDPNEPREGNLPDNKLSRLSQDPFYKPKVMKYNGDARDGFTFSSYQELEKEHELRPADVPSLEVISPPKPDVVGRFLSHSGSVPVNYEAGINWLSVGVVSRQDQTLAVLDVRHERTNRPGGVKAQYITGKELDNLRNRVKVLINLDDGQQLPEQNKMAPVKVFRTPDVRLPYRVVLEEQRQEFTLSQQSMLRLNDMLNVTQNKVNSQYKVLVR